MEPTIPTAKELSETIHESLESACKAFVKICDGISEARAAGVSYSDVPNEPYQSSFIASCIRKVLESACERVVNRTVPNLGIEISIPRAYWNLDKARSRFDREEGSRAERFLLEAKKYEDLVQCENIVSFLAGKEKLLYDEAMDKVATKLEGLFDFVDRDGNFGGKSHPRYVVSKKHLWNGLKSSDARDYARISRYLRVFETETDAKVVDTIHELHCALEALSYGHILPSRTKFGAAGGLEIIVFKSSIEFRLSHSLFESLAAFISAYSMHDYLRDGYQIGLGALSSKVA